MVKRFHGNQKTNEQEEKSKKSVEKQQNDIQEEIAEDNEKEEQIAGDTETGETKTDTAEIADAKLAELENKYIRLSAEFDNYRKRTLKEKVDLIRTAGADIILRIIPVLDDFERAIGFISDNDNNAPGGDGILLIYNKLRDILMQQGLKEIEALNKDFDTDIHEAVTKIPAPEESMKGKVVGVIEKGYFLYDKVIRYAKVVVGE